MRVPLVSMSIPHAQLQPTQYALLASIFRYMLHMWTLVRLFMPVNGCVILDTCLKAALAPSAPSISGVAWEKHTSVPETLLAL